MPANMSASTKSSEALLKIDPEHELQFRGSSKEAICVQLKLQNVTNGKVAFKVKTTAPKRYCVKPTSGILEGKGEINVLLSLQPASPSDTKDKGKHKFQVLSIPAPEGDFNVDFLWKEAKPEQIQDHKLKCVLELDDSGAVKADAVPREAATGVKPVEVEDARSQQETLKLESELQKAAEEISKLRDEYKRLTKENIELKEESIRVRRSAVSSSGEKSTVYVPRDIDTQIAEPGMSAPQLIMIFAAVLLGMILSKFLF